MVMKTHAPKGIGKGYLAGILITETLLIFISVCLFTSIRQLDAQEKPQRPSKYACPVTANLFPLQERSADTLKFTFPDNEVETPAGKGVDFSSVAQRISIALLTPDGKEVEIPFRWNGSVFTNPRIEWGGHSGSFIVKGDGSQNCFLLGTYAGLPGNIPCVEFSLTIPPGVEVKDVHFSSLYSEYVSRDCPMPELGRQIKEAYEDSRLNPIDEARTAKFISLLERAIPEYDCIPKGGGRPAPALHMVDLNDQLDWINHLYKKVEETNESALRVYAGIYDISGGIVSEMMDDQIWRIIHDRPQFILENWRFIKGHKHNILESHWMQNPKSNADAIEIYRNIATKEPKHKPACDEIIRILSERPQVK